MLVGLVGVMAALAKVGARFSTRTPLLMLVKPPYGSMTSVEQSRVSCGEISVGVSVRLEVEPSIVDVV